jgi:hypothetical protein
MNNGKAAILGLLLWFAPGISWAVDAATQILCDRTNFVRQTAGLPMRLLETGIGDKRTGIYGLSAVTIPADGWQIDAITIFTTAADPAKWRTLDSARLNVITKRDDEVPRPDDDPTQGREVKVTVQELADGVFAVRTAGLALTLAPGDYWIGLTPIRDVQKHGQGVHRLVHSVRDARFDDVIRSPDGERGAMRHLMEWNTIGPRILSPMNEHLSIRVEGTRINRGQLLEWPATPPAERKQLHFRFAAFDPLNNPPMVPAGQQAAPTGRLWIVQSRATVNQVVRDALTRAGAVLLQYLPDDAYLVNIDPAAVDGVRALASVRWVGPYHPAFRLDAGVCPEAARDSFGRMSPAGEPQGMRRVRVYLFERNEAAKAAVSRSIRDHGGEVLYTSSHGKYLIAQVPVEQLVAVAGLDEVCGVERLLGGFELSQMTRDSYGGAAARITLAQVRELCGADRLEAAAGYAGLGVRVAFWDDGVQADHIDLVGRPLTVVGPKMQANANHGTAIAGILCGEGRGNPQARGLLPQGGLIFAAYRSGTDALDGYDLVDKFVNEYRAALMSDSGTAWGGSGEIAHYDGYANVLDDWVLTHDLSYCKAMSNGSQGIGSAGAWAKNVVHVGGVEPNASVLRDKHRPLNATTGPGPDGRVKPDLVQFGYGVYTTHAAGLREATRTSQAQAAPRHWRRVTSG